MEMCKDEQIEFYKNIATKLYDLLDDIDSAGDMAKSNDKAYRNIVEGIQKKKNIYAYSEDGYGLTFRSQEEQDVKMKEFGNCAVHGYGNTGTAPVTKEEETPEPPVPEEVEKIWINTNLVFSKEEREKKLHEFEDDLARLINSHSLENMSDTPDFILANYLTNCLRAFNESTKKRNKWYSK